MRAAPSRARAHAMAVETRRGIGSEAGLTEDEPFDGVISGLLIESFYSKRGIRVAPGGSSCLGRWVLRTQQEKIAAALIDAMKMQFASSSVAVRDAAVVAVAAGVRRQESGTVSIVRGFSAEVRLTEAVRSIVCFDLPWTWSELTDGVRSFRRRPHPGCWLSCEAV